MTGHRPFSELRKAMSPERRQRNEQVVAEMLSALSLDELRQARNHTQQELARALNVGQPAVAKMEQRADMYVSNLRRYIEALGGTLEITARFPDGAVSIRSFSDIGDST